VAPALLLRGTAKDRFIERQLKLASLSLNPQRSTLNRSFDDEIILNDSVAHNSFTAIVLHSTSTLNEFVTLKPQLQLGPSIQTRDAL